MLVGHLCNRSYDKLSDSIFSGKLRRIKREGEEGTQRMLRDCQSALEPIHTKAPHLCRQNNVKCIVGSIVIDSVKRGIQIE